MSVPQKPDLEHVQRWMQSVITHPQGVQAGLASDAARKHLDLAPSQVEQLIEPSRAETSVERLGIYATAYFARLIECLEAEFPVLRQTVGEEAFADFAFQYLLKRPSTSYTLSELGAGFSEFLEKTKPPTIGNPARPAWPEFLVDLARLERAFSEVFDGPGVEGRQTLAVEELSAIDPQIWPDVRLAVVPCFRLFASRFPLNEFYTTTKQGQHSTMPEAAESWMAITRREYIVRRYELTRPQFVLLDALRLGHNVGEAIAAAVEVYTGGTELLQIDLQTWFHNWAAAPLFERIARN